MAAWNRRQEPFSLLILDVDHFKKLNDTYGHDTGDRALRVFSRAVRMAIRDDDIVARYGGEEFTIIVPHTNVVTAAPVLHRIRTQLATELAGAEVPPFTVSIGLVDSSLAGALAAGGPLGGRGGRWAAAARGWIWRREGITASFSWGSRKPSRRGASVKLTDPSAGGSVPMRE